MICIRSINKGNGMSDFSYEDLVRMVSPKFFSAMHSDWFYDNSVGNGDLTAMIDREITFMGR